jgi:membrane fusion protein, multidrug efflux system
MDMNVRRFIGLPAALILLVPAGCGEPPKKASAPPKVTVSQPIQKDVTKFVEYTGNTSALESVDIRARVSGFLEKINFQPQARVKQGELLFVIDPRQYQASVDQAAATLEAKKAALKLAKTDEELAKSLEAKQAISWLKLQEAVSRSGVSQGDVDMAAASLENAKLNLEFTQVTSPINGRVSRNLVDVGNLVGATEKTLLTYVVNDESVYCYFNISEVELLSFKRGAKKEPEKGIPAESTIKALKIPCQMSLADEKGFPHEGIIDFADVKVNPATGTVQVRGVFPNPDGLLMQGMFARVRIPYEKGPALLVPAEAVLFDQGGRYVLAVTQDNVVLQKRVKAGTPVDEMLVVEEGLTPNDRVIVNGIQRARPGSKVNPETAKSKPGESSNPALEPAHK